MILKFKKMVGACKSHISGLKVIHYADEKIDEHDANVKKKKD